MEKVFVFGHKKPDTDSVCAAIAMAYLMNKVNNRYEVVPRILGAINNESKFVLERFGVKCPKYLNDVKYSFNSYTMNRTSICCGVASLCPTEKRTFGFASFASITNCSMPSLSGANTHTLASSPALSRSG